MVWPDLPRHEIETRTRASEALAEYRLVSQGVTTYERLGYDTGNGAAEHKLLEYLVIDGLISKAQQSKQHGANRR